MIRRGPLLAAAFALLALPAVVMATGEASTDTAETLTGPGSTGSSTDATAGEAGGAGGTSGGTGAGAGAMTAGEVSGTVDSIDATRRRVTIRDDQGNLVSYDLAPGATVQVGSRDASLSALSNGDAVTIGVSDADPTQAQSIRVNTAQ